MISIIVDNFNRSYLLPLLMKCYARETFTETPVEMVIVDDASDPEDHFVEYLRLGLEIVKPWFKVRAFRIPVSTHFNGGRTFNVAAKQSKGDLLVINPPDMIPVNPKTLSIIHREHEETKSLYLTSRVLSAKRIVPQPLDERAELGKNQPGGASMPMSMYDELGGFDEKFIGYGYVDADFIYRLINYAPKDKKEWTNKQNTELVYIHLDQTKVPVRRENPIHDELITEAWKLKRWKVNPGGWGICNDLEEIVLEGSE